MFDHIRSHLITQSWKTRFADLLQFRFSAIFLDAWCVQMHQIVKPINFLSRNEAPIPTHFFLILTSCQNSTLSPPSNCEGLKVYRAFILPHRPDYTEVCKVSDTSRSFHRFAKVPLPLHTSRFSLPLLFSSGWLGLGVGGRVDAVPRRSGPRHWAPDGTQLLPRQVISGKDAAAQDISLQSVKP